MRKSNYGEGNEREFRNQLRDENRALKQELTEQRHGLLKLQTEMKVLQSALLSISDKTTQLLRAQEMRYADMQLMMYTMADKYMPSNEDFLNKPAH
jgi:CII-binding regulator of phage lambda lysogenization HflD